MKLSNLLHHCLVDRQPSCRIDKQHIVVVLLRPIDCRFRDIHRPVSRCRRKEVRTCLARNRLQLLNRCWTIHVTRDHQNLLLLRVTQELCQFPDRRSLTRPLQPRHQNNRWRLRRKIEPHMRFAHQTRQLLMDDSDKRLARAQGANNLFADRLFPDRRDQSLDRGKRDVGLEQRQANFAQGICNVVFGEASFAS